MKITIWHGCKVIDEGHYDAPGPDISFDPWASLIRAGSEVPINYHLGLRETMALMFARTDTPENVDLEVS